MRVATMTALFAAAVLSVPTEVLQGSGSAILDPSVVDQGDGFYVATFDNETGAPVVEFTPVEELNKRDPVEQLAARSSDKLVKRVGITCAGQNSGNVPALDQANIQAARNADGRTYGDNAWGWVHNGAETSYFCVYRQTKLSYNSLINLQISVSDACGGSAAYGFNRIAPSGISNLAVGRTFRGNNFCDGSFHQK